MTVRGIAISRFRGIPDELRLILPSAPRSALLLVGDNGTGKSSIADAFEVGLQARLWRRKDRLGELARSHADHGPPLIEVELDSRTVVRAFEVGDAGRIVLRGRDAAAGYEFAPVVLRRTDIVGFWDVPERQRQVVFVDFAGEHRVLRGDPAEQVAAREADVAKLKAERNDLRRRLAHALGLPENRIPADADGFVRFREEINGRYRDPKSGRLRIPRTIYGLLASYAAGVRAVKRGLDQLDKARAAARQLPEADGALIGDLLAQAGRQLTRSYRAITGDDWVETVELAIGDTTDASLSVRLRLANGRVSSPRMLSEARRDLIALLLFVAIVRSAADRGQDRFLILDDIFHSVDATIRVSALEEILTVLDGWQLVVTTHDRFWQQRATETLRNHGFHLTSVEIVKWSFEGGPVVRGAVVGPRARLKRQLDDGDPHTLAAVAGQVHEEMCEHLSVVLPTAVVRQPNDRYTIGHLWPNIHKKLRSTDIAGQADGVAAVRYMRNLTGAHYEELAQQLSQGEASDYAERVLALLDAVHCTDCESWTKRRGGEWRCNCGHTVFRPVN